MLVKSASAMSIPLPEAVQLRSQTTVRARHQVKQSSLALRQRIHLASNWSVCCVRLSAMLILTAETPCEALPPTADEIFRGFSFVAPRLAQSEKQELLEQEKLEEKVLLFVVFLRETLVCCSVLRRR